MRAELRERFDRLERTRHRLEGRLEGVDSARLSRPRSGGGWSALQVLHHVVTAETLSLTYVTKKMQGGATLPSATVRSPLRLLVLRAVLASPLRLRAPAATASVPPQVEWPPLRTRWDETRASWRELLDGFPPELLGRMVFRHPLVGLLSLHDCVGFLQAHLDHHARQVDRAVTL